MIDDNLEKWYKGELVYSYSDVKEIFGYERGRVEEWVKGGFVDHITCPYGTKRIQVLFTKSHLYSLALFQLLRNYGMKRKIAKTYTDIKWSLILRGEIKYMAITSNKDGNYSSFFNKREDALTSSNFMLKIVINLWKITEEVKKKI